MSGNNDAIQKSRSHGETSLPKEDIWEQASHIYSDCSLAYGSSFGCFFLRAIGFVYLPPTETYIQPTVYSFTPGRCRLDTEVIKRWGTSNGHIRSAGPRSGDGPIIDSRICLCLVFGFVYNFIRMRIVIVKRASSVVSALQTHRLYRDKVCLLPILRRILHRSISHIQSLA